MVDRPIRQLQIAQGLREVLRGIQLDHSKHGKPTHSRLSITPAISKQVKPIWIKDRDRIPFNNIILWAACLTIFFSFCRSGKITVERENLYDPACHLSYSDLAVDNPSNLSIISMLIKNQKQTKAGMVLKYTWAERETPVSNRSVGGLPFSKRV